MQFKFVFIYFFLCLASPKYTGFLGQELVDVQSGFSYTSNKASSISKGSSNSIYYSIEHSSELIVGGNTVTTTANKSITIIEKFDNGISHVIFSVGSNGALYNSNVRYYNGIIYLGGIFNDTLFFSDTSFYCSTLKSFFLLGIDSTGKIVNHFISNSYSAGMNDFWVNETGVYAGGDFFGPFSIDSNHYTSIPGVNFFLLHFTHELSPIDFIQSNGNATTINGLTADKEGNILCIGSYGASSSINGSPLPDVSGDHNLFCTKLTSNLQPLWTQTITGNVQVHGLCITVNQWNDIYVGGEFEMNVDVGNQILSAVGQMDGMLAKLGSDGTILWVKGIGGPNTDQLKSIQCNSMNEIILSMNLGRNATYTNDSLLITGFSEPYIIALNSTDDVKWYSHLPSTPNTGSVSMEELFVSDSSIFICGANKTGIFFQNTYLDSDNIEDFYLAEFEDKEYTSSVSLEEMDSILLFYPNPFLSAESIKLSTTVKEIHKILDIHGNQIPQEAFWGDNISKGIYFIHLTTQQNTSLITQLIKL